MIDWRLMLLALCGGWACGSAVAGGAPKIEFDQRVYDFGTTSQVQSVTGVFMVWNTGTAALHVGALHTSCVCTRASIEPATLAPGEGASLMFSINIGPSVGDIAEKIYVPTDDPETALAVLTLKLHVNSIYEITPAVIKLGNLPRGSTTNLTAVVQRTDGQKLRITKLDAGLPNISARAVPIRESKGQAARIQIKLKSTGAPGPFVITLYGYTGEMYAEDVPRPSFEFDLVGQIVEPSPR